ncbi:hypothetical protein VPHD148_0270 [Vibrio phage D148]
MAEVFAAGALRIKNLLPEGAKSEYDKYKHEPLNKGKVNKLISTIITHGGKDAANGISRVSNEFYHQATQQGYSTPLDDYYNDSEDRNVMMQEFKTKVDQINLKNVPQSQKEDLLNELTNEYQGRLSKQNLDFMINKGSTAAKMALTGARGNPAQLQQGTSTPLMSKDIKGTPIPVAITSSYAEGLSPAEQLAMSYWGRGNTVSAQLSTSKPGAMFKALTPNMYHEVITESDCGTSNGDQVDITDKRKMIGRFEAGTNHSIDEAYYKELKSSGKKYVMVRGPLTCESHEGICQKCYGKDARSTVPDVGENVGVLAAQSASEVLTQMVLSTKHDAKAGKGAKPFDTVNNLLVNPGTFKNKATISTLDGKVTDIIKTPLNDHKVFVGGVEHFVAKERGLRVKKGDTVRIGQELSDGIANPRELVSLRGTGEGRKYLANTLRSIYEGQGNDLDTRHFDIIAKNMIKHVEITHSGDTDYLPGQKVSINALQKHLQGDMEEKPLGAATGRILARGILHMTVGTKLDEQHIQDLHAKGIDKVWVSKSDLGITPIVPGLHSVKQLDENWVSKLAARDLGKTIKTGVAMGHSSEVSSTDPIAAYIMGSSFGEGTGGRY